MGDSKGGGQADNSGMMQAMISAQAAEKAYQLGEEQFQWSKDVWTQEQPLIDAAQQAQIDYSTQLAKSLTQMQDESGQQWQEYQDTYLPLERQYAGEVQNWDSPSAIAKARGAAMGDVAEQGMAGLNTAAETLRAYGVNPGSPRYASMYVTAQPMLGAAQAAAGTTAADRLRMEKMGLEAGAINTGRGMVNTTGSLTGVGTGAGSAGAGAASGAGQTAFGNVGATGVGAGAASGLFNAGSNAMNTYVNAVDGYNSANADFAKAASASMGGFGSALGTIGGALIGKFEDGGGVGPTPQQGGGMTGIPATPMPPPLSESTSGGGVPAYASASGGKITDDVPAQLNVGEYVVDKAAAQWLGHKTLANLVDKARKEIAHHQQRPDVGGEPTMAIPQRPTFVSRPMQGAIPGMA